MPIRVPKMNVAPGDPLFKRMVGPSEIHDDDWGWNILGAGSNGDETCQLCGEYYPEGESVTRGEFLGLQYIEQCCGGIADHLYRTFGHAFFSQKLREIAADPTAHGFELKEIKDALAVAKAKLDETSKTVSDAQDSAEGLK